MAFVDNRIGGRILQGILPARYTVETAAVKTGDVLNVSAGGTVFPFQGEVEPVFAIAGHDAEEGETVLTYVMALVTGRYSWLPGDVPASRLVNISDSGDALLTFSTLEGRAVGLICPNQTLLLAPGFTFPF